MGQTQKGSCTYEKDRFFLIEKYNEDVRQDEKHAPDLLEAITQPPGLVKEELQPILFKIIQLRSKITKIRVSTFWILEFQSFPAGGQHNLLAQQVLSKKRPSKT